MGRQSQSRQARRAAERRQQQRAHGRGQQGQNWAYIAGGAVVAAAVIIFIVFAVKGTSNGAAGATTPTPFPTGRPIASIGCDGGMTNPAVPHIHADLAIYDRGKYVQLPQGTGHNTNEDCTFWVHAHQDAAFGVIHMESPHAIHPTLDTYLSIARRTVPASQVPRLTPKPGEQEKVWVNQKPYHGNPLNIKLYQHMTVTVEFGPPFVKPKPFDFAAHQL